MSLTVSAIARPIVTQPAPKGPPNVLARASVVLARDVRTAPVTGSGGVVRQVVVQEEPMSKELSMAWEVVETVKELKAREAALMKENRELKADLVARTLLWNIVSSVQDAAVDDRKSKFYELFRRMLRSGALADPSVLEDVALTELLSLDEVLMLNSTEDTGVHVTLSNSAPHQAAVVSPTPSSNHEQRMEICTSQADCRSVDITPSGQRYLPSPMASPGSGVLAKIQAEPMHVIAIPNANTQTNKNCRPVTPVHVNPASCMTEVEIMDVDDTLSPTSPTSLSSLERLQYEKKIEELLLQIGDLQAHQHPEGAVPRWNMIRAAVTDEREKRKRAERDVESRDARIKELEATVETLTAERSYKRLRFTKVSSAAVKH